MSIDTEWKKYGKQMLYADDSEFLSMSGSLSQTPDLYPNVSMAWHEYLTVTSKLIFLKMNS